MSTKLIYDIESDGLDINGIIHIIAVMPIIDGVNQPVMKYTSRPIKGSSGSFTDFTNYLSTLDESATMIGFNSQNFDKPYIERFFNASLNCQHLDVMLLAKLMFTKDELIAMDRGISDMPPKLWGSFSLKAFGYRLGEFKDEYDGGWEALNEEMVKYCDQDVVVTATLYHKLMSMGNVPNDDVITLEHKVASIIAEQERFGFYFDTEAAKQLSLDMLLKKGSIQRQLIKVFHPKYLPEGPIQTTNKTIRTKKYITNNTFKYWTPFNTYRKPLSKYKSGKLRLPAKSKYKWFSEPKTLTYIHKDGEYQNIKLTKFNPGSRQHIVTWLKSMYNWEPEIFTPSGNPKVDATTLDNLPYEEAQPLKEYLKLVKDLGQLTNGDNSLLNLVGEDHRFHGRVDTLGANTGRMTHSKPNITQVPKAEAFRRLMTVPEGKVLIDVDADALELVMLGHYLGPYDNYFYAQTVDSGDKSATPPTDIHSVNQRATDLPTRDLAKTFIYGYLYGSGNTRIGWGLWNSKTEETLQFTESEWATAKQRVEGRLIDIDSNNYFPIAKDRLIPYTDTLIKQTIFGTQTANNFLAKTDGLLDLVNDTKQKAESDELYGLYGHKLHTRSPHSALNLLLQHAGAVYMKYYLSVIDKNMRAAGLVSGIDFGYVANIHDAVNIETTPEVAKVISPILEAGFLEASNDLGLKYPVAGKPSIGKDQWETH